MKSVINTLHYAWERGGYWDSCTIRSFVICMHRLILLGWSNQGGWHGRNMWHAWGRREIHTRYWWKPPKGSDRSEDLRVYGRATIKLILKKHDWLVRNGFISLAGTPVYIQVMLNDNLPPHWAPSQEGLLYTGKVCTGHEFLRRIT
jgi:hypothetical protein